MKIDLLSLHFDRTPDNFRYSPVPNCRGGLSSVFEQISPPISLGSTFIEFDLKTAYPF